MRRWDSLWEGEPLFLAPRFFVLLSQILQEYVPGHAVWAFGSRATGRQVWRFSDLDLAVEGRLTSGERAALKDALEESLLPILVDVVELGSVDAEFADRIRPQFFPLQQAQPMEPAVERRLQGE